MKRIEIAGWALTALGLLQAVGYVSGLHSVKLLGAATAAAPLPLLFNDADGLDSSISDLILEYGNTGGELAAIPVNFALYSRFRGPYLRRLAYGAAITQGPEFNSVLFYGFCRPAPLARAFGIEANLGWVSLRVKARGKARNAEYDEVWKQSVKCAQ